MFSQELVASRFQRLTLKGEQVSTMDPVKPDEIRELEELLQNLFPGINMEKLTKAGLKKNKAYHDWLEKHCKQSTYCFQIRK